MMPPEVVLSLLRRESSTGFQRLAGTRFEGTVPIPGAEIARALRASLPEGGAITAVDIALQEGGRAVLLLAMDRFPLPRRVEIPIVLEPSPETPDEALDLRLEPGGLLRFVLPLVSAAFNRPGVAFSGNRARLLVKEMPELPEDRAIAGLLRSIRARTIPGVLLLDFVVEVPYA